jgi:tRNA-splicing endonuclease subunit Sen34
MLFGLLISFPNNWKKVGEFGRRSLPGGGRAWVQAHLATLNILVSCFPSASSATSPSWVEPHETPSKSLHIQKGMFILFAASHLHSFAMIKQHLFNQSVNPLRLRSLTTEKCYALYDYASSTPLLHTHKHMFATHTNMLQSLDESLGIILAIQNMASPSVAEPFPVFLVGGRYTLYDINTVSHARRVHNISGVLIGGLPQAPQQNVFLGIPLELMPEEARLLVEKGVAYIVDDTAVHKQAFIAGGLSKEEKEKFLRSLKKQGSDATKMQTKSADDRKIAALKKVAAKNAALAAKLEKERSEAAAVGNNIAEDDEESLFASPAPSKPSIAPSEASVTSSSSSTMKITPTTSHPPLTTSTPSSPLPLPSVPVSYPLFKHLHSKGYFMAPGIRFGCRYTAYPGDPLRFHSHFLCDGMDWDQEFDLLTLVGGGRLGTGVKKGFLIGGAEDKVHVDSEEEVRAFCVEWAGM